MSAKLPPALKALRRSLAGATEVSLRERIQEAIRGLERLYGISSGPTRQDDGDMKRRTFCQDRHPAPRRKYASDLASTDDTDLM